MFHGVCPSGALSVTESSLSVRLTSGENISTAAGRLFEFMLMRRSTVPNRPPPPESPARISRSGGRPLETKWFVTARMSSAAAGNGNSGASR